MTNKHCNILHQGPYKIQNIPKGEVDTLPPPLGPLPQVSLPADINFKYAMTCTEREPVNIASNCYKNSKHFLKGKGGTLCPLPPPPGPTLRHQILLPTASQMTHLSNKDISSTLSM